MSNFRRTTIRGKKSNSESELIGDLVDSGALIFTKTTFDMTTIKKGGGFWRFLIRIIQWFRWAKSHGNPSTITHVDGWDGKVAFGSDLCDPDGGGLNRHDLPIVPHCFIRGDNSTDLLNLTGESIEVITKKRSSMTLKVNELAFGEYEVIQLPEYLRIDFLNYQEKFKNDDIKYSLTKAAKSAFVRSKFNTSVQKIAIADAIYCLLGQPFRDSSGSVIEVCCSTFLVKILMAIEHKQSLESIIYDPNFEMFREWELSLKNLNRGFEKINELYLQYRKLFREFDSEWKKIHRSKSKHKNSLLMHLCVDFEERRGFALRKIRKLSRNLSRRIYSMASKFYSSGYYQKYIDAKEKPILFRLSPECVTPAKLYFFLYEIVEKRQ
ncbi:MAG: hypothetical protein S4CHLAM6_02200 [Chlamydiae bacterium]|nr:hypothetical protein [Chlamydiota bacterium]